jgi:ParB/RepB/Spo0J family partition protein
MTIANSESGIGIRALMLEQLQVSTTAGQTERRKHFNKAELEELAKSVKTVGVLQPILARPVNGHFEIVFGERRFIAAKLAGLTAIDVSVRTLSDEQVLEVQLIENLQREGLHPLAEAEGYEQLQKYGHSAEEIADKLGKSKAYVYGRMKLLALGPAAREAFYRGDLNASTALLLARIPVASVQRDAVGKITKGRYDDAPMSYRDARDYIEREYMLRLGDAPFPTGNAELLPKAGACGPCPKRTGNQAELFADVKSADVCTDPVCFKLKREAWAKLQIVQAKEAGREVITGAEAKKIAAYGDQSFAGGFTRLDAKCWDDPKHRTYKQILGKEAAPVLVQLPKGGDLVELVQKNDAIKKLKADGVIKPQTGSVRVGSSKKKADSIAEKIDNEFRELVFLAIHAKAPKKLSHAILVKLVDHELDAIAPTETLQKAWGFKDFGLKAIEKLNEGQLQQLLFEIQLLDSMEFAGTPELVKAAKELGVDVKKIRAELTAAAKPAKKKAKAKK